MIPEALAYYFVVVLLGQPYQSGPYLTPGACAAVRAEAAAVGADPTVCYRAPVTVTGEETRDA